MSRTFQIYDYGTIHTIVVDTGKQLKVRDLVQKYGEKIGAKDPWIDLMRFDDEPFLCDRVQDFFDLAELFLDNNTPIENIDCDKLRVVCGSDW